MASMSGSIGGVSNDQLAHEARSTRTTGIMVDDHGMISDPDIHAAGGCAHQHNAHAGDWMRLISPSLEQASDMSFDFKSLLTPIKATGE